MGTSQFWRLLLLFLAAELVWAVQYKAFGCGNNVADLQKQIDTKYFQTPVWDYTGALSRLIGTYCCNGDCIPWDAQVRTIIDLIILRAICDNPNGIHSAAKAKHIPPGAPVETTAHQPCAFRMA
ncbi:hypothetical protein TWF718_008236 [Orbilia javanica]|uniref:Uncharacterized protein n=1 Tax=Orbilia javanica TaxID=47235 RepID=A0AAN8RMS4_9PEZI